MSQRILVVEDSATELAVIVGALRSSGFEVMTGSPRAFWDATWVSGDRLA